MDINISDNLWRYAIIGLASVSATQPLYTYLGRYSNPPTSSYMP